MKRWSVCLLLLFCAHLFAAPVWAFNKPLAPHTRGNLHPHVLRTNTYSLNARNVKALAQHGKDLWMGTSMGLIRYDTGSVENYQVFDNTNGLLSNGIFSISMDPAGRPWIGTYGGGLSVLDDSGWVNFNTPHGLLDSFVYDLHFSQGDLWIATWSGVNRVRGDLFARDSWKSFTVENTNGGLIDNWVYGIEVDKKGRIWFGTESGISMLDDGKWRKWNHENGLGAQHGEVREDNLAVMSPFTGEHHTEHSAPALPNTSTLDYRPNYVVSFLLDHKDRLWIGTWGGGLSVLDTRTFTFRNFTQQNGLPGNYILALKEGPFGDLWIGSNAGLSRFDGEIFENFGRINGLSGGFVFSIEFGPGHSLWIGGHQGVDRLRLDPSARDPGRL